MTDLPGRPARRAGGRAAARPDDAAAHPRGRPRHHPQDAVEALRRRAGRVGADALPRPGHHVRLQPGRLRHGLPVLRHRPGRPRSATCRPPRSSSRSSPAPGRWPAARCPAGPGRVSNVVFMGMGEPLANYKAVIGAVRRLTDPAPAGLGMSARGVTVSTVGLVPRMNQLTDEGIPVTLALSLHAPDDELRNELVPINTRFSVAETVAAAWNYAAHDQAPGLHRVRHDARHQRPGLAGRPARRGAQRLRRLGLGARQPDPAQPHARARSGPRPTRPTSASSSAGSSRTASRPPSATPAAARSTAPADSWPRPSRERPSRGRRGGAVGRGSGCPRPRSPWRRRSTCWSRMPDWFDVQLELLRLDPERPVGDVVDEVLARARELGRPGGQLLGQARTTTRPLDAVLLARGGVLDETLDVLALDLTDGLPDVGPWDQRIDAALGDRRRRRHATTTRSAMVVFGGAMAPDDELERAAADGRRQLAGRGAVAPWSPTSTACPSARAASPSPATWPASGAAPCARKLAASVSTVPCSTPGCGYGRDHGATMALVQGPHPDLRPDPAPGRLRAVRRGALVPRPAGVIRVRRRTRPRADVGRRSWQAVRRVGHRAAHRCRDGGSAPEQVRGLVHVVDEVDVRLHRAAAGQGLEQRPRGQGLGPVRRGRPAPSARPRTRRRSSSRRRPGTPPGRCRPAPGRKTMPASQTSRRIASRMALRTYLAMRGGEHVGRLVPVEPGRDAEGVAAAGEPVEHREAGAHPGVDRRPERRDVGQQGQRRRAGRRARGRGRPGSRRGWRPPSRRGRRRWRPRGRAPSRSPRRAASR